MNPQNSQQRQAAAQAQMLSFPGVGDGGGERRIVETGGTDVLLGMDEDQS